MTGSLTAVDLSKLPFPDAVETFSFETILAQMIIDLQARDPAFSALVESDPAYKILEVCAYRETLIRQRVNESIKAVMLASATGADLDNIAANFNVQRLVITPANPDTIPPTSAVMESDTDLRRRVQLSFEGFSTAGSRGAYIYHALSADPAVLDADAYGPPETPGVVRVAVLSRTGSGIASAPLLAAVNAALDAEETRPITDLVTVESAAIVNYSVNATVKFYPGPDSAVVLAAANAAVVEYAANNHRLGRDVTLSGLYRALHQEGVQDVVITSPTANVVANWNQATWCTGITIAGAGTDE